tara:strand:+ start:1512 stop:2468 length:957 start_codon:yes stop_codon:yes gene_type:complete
MINKGLVVIPTQGFANRMKILASSKIYADEHNLDLTVCWIPSEECNISLEDIFVANFFKTITLESLQKTKYCYFGRVHTNSLFDKLDSAINDQIENFDYILLEGGHEFCQLNRLQFLSKKRKFYSSLQFKSEINDRVNEFFYKIDNRPKIGIHYRDIIKQFDQLDIDNNDVVNFTNNSPLESFKNTINKLKHVDLNHFIVVSNSDKAIKYLSEHFTDISFLVTETSKYDRNNKADMIDSVVDFLILSRCDMIIGSYFSSFSDEASFFNLIPKVTPLSNNLISNISETVRNYHCINYSFIDNIAALNYNDKIFINKFNL